jgi:hypothetical protein
MRTRRPDDAVEAIDSRAPFRQVGLHVLDGRIVLGRSRCPGLRERRLAPVDADHVARGSDPARDRAGDVAASAADVQHAHARLQGCATQKVFGDGGEDLHQRDCLSQGRPFIHKAVTLPGANC